MLGRRRRQWSNIHPTLVVFWVPVVYVIYYTVVTLLRFTLCAGVDRGHGSKAAPKRRLTGGPTSYDVTRCLNVILGSVGSGRARSLGFSRAVVGHTGAIDARWPVMGGVHGSPASLTSPWSWKGVSATSQSGWYTLSYPKGRGLLHAGVSARQEIAWSSTGK